MMGFYGNVWVRQHEMAKAGDVHESHTHPYDHVTFVTAGVVRVRWKVPDDLWAKVKDRARWHEKQQTGEKVFTAPTWLVVAAEVEHQIIAIEDGSVYWCVHALRSVDGGVMEVFGPENDPTVANEGVPANV